LFTVSGLVTWGAGVTLTKTTDTFDHRFKIGDALGGLIILGIAGSLRRDSYNRSLLRAAASLAPPNLELETADIASIPLFEGDMESAGMPEAVHTLRKQIAAADAVLIATPEYNRSIPGVLKNVIDCVSRPPDPPLTGKPVAIFGASPGPYGTIRAQHHLRTICSILAMLLLPRPEVLVPRAKEKFDLEGDLTDEATRELVRKMMLALEEWTLRRQRGKEAAGTGT